MVYGMYATVGCTPRGTIGWVLPARAAPALAAKPGSLNRCRASLCPLCAILRSSAPVPVVPFGWLRGRAPTALRPVGALLCLPVTWP